MNLSTKQKPTHRYREKPGGAKGESGAGWTESLGLADTNYYIQMDKQGPTAQHRELYSIP